jgi:hypothetical protein
MNIHAPRGIRTHNPSNRVVVDPRLRPHGHWDWPLNDQRIINNNAFCNNNVRLLWTCFPISLEYLAVSVKANTAFARVICAPRVFCAPYFLRDDFGFIFAPSILRTIVLSIYQSSHYLPHKYTLNTVLQYCCLYLKIRGRCSWGNCEQDCTVIYSKYFSCFSTIPVCTCVKISRWRRRIIVIQRRTN